MPNLKKARYIGNVLRVSFSEALASIEEFFELNLERLNEKMMSLGAQLLKVIETNVGALLIMSVGSVIAFLLYHIIVISAPGFSALEKTMVLGLLACEVVFANNRIGYIYSFSRAAQFKSARDQYLTKSSSSKVACLVAVCNEPIDVVSETVASICAMEYENKQVYVLDDSTKKENIEKVAAMADAYGVTLMRRKDRKNYKAGNINSAIKKISADYISVFDSDMRPSAGFLRDLVPLLDKDPKLALVQTPQDYENNHSPMARAAALQNGLFYEHICESKDVSGAVFCCGTNFVMRLKAIREIGGFETYSITEDFATTLKLHANGWKTTFNDKRYATGLGPETLGEYFKQHSRWATGTFQVARAAAKLLLTNPRALSGRQWFDYWLSFSYYLSGMANLYLLLLPTAYILFGIGLIKDQGVTYLMFFMVAFVFSYAFFLFTLVKRGYPIRIMITICARLETCKFAIYTQAFFAAFLSLKTTFKVTEKGTRAGLPWSSFLIPLVFLGVNTVSAVVGLYRLGTWFDFYLALNTFWAVFNVWQLSAIIQYNSGSEFLEIKYFNRFKFGQKKATASASAGDPGAS